MSSIFMQILFLAGCGLAIFLIYRTIKNRPDNFTRQSISQSLTTLGILGIILICFVALLIMLVRA